MEELQNYFSKFSRNNDESYGGEMSKNAVFSIFVEPRNQERSCPAASYGLLVKETCHFIGVWGRTGD